MDVKLPQLAEGVESGTVVSILVSEGQPIKRDQAFMELETQKAVGSIPAPESGVITRVHVKEGMEVSVGQVLISIETGAAAKSSPEQTMSAATADQAPNRPVSPPDGAGPREPAPAPQAAPFQYQPRSGLPPPAPPSVRKIARDLGIDLTRVRGSEAGGRIRLSDVRQYIERLQQIAFQELEQAAPVAAPAAGAVPQKAIDFSRWGPVRREKLPALRRTVSRRMIESWTTIPKIDQFDDADITGLLELRKKHSATYEAQGARLTLTPFLLLVLARALAKHPYANASLDENSGEIVFKDYYHIGVAVDTDAGLIVPVLRDTDKKNLLQLSRELQELTEKTRQRKIELEELQGGTFTISNQGSIGGSHFTPIIYSPQVAILGVGKGQNKPVVVDGKIAVRTMLPLCLAYDHRLLDGANAVRFLNDVITGLQSIDETDLKL